MHQRGAPDFLALQTLCMADLNDLTAQTLSKIQSMIFNK
jgi:hypothetical protein